MTNRSVRLATYNLHGCVGTDGKEDVPRICEVIRAMRADVVGLQEVRVLYPDGHLTDQLAEMSDSLGFHAVPGPTLHSADGYFGNAIVSRYPIVRATWHPFGTPKTEPRGILNATLSVAGTALNVLVTHFGLRARERRAQARALIQVLGSTGTQPVVLAGDFNEWRPRGFTVTALNRHFGPVSAIRSFPSVFPLLPLDRIWVHPRGALVAVRAHRSALSRRASDHLPVFVDLQL